MHVQWLFPWHITLPLNYVALPKIQVSRGVVWIDLCQVIIARERPNRRDIAVPHPFSREGHHSTTRRISSFLLSYLIP